MQIMTILGSPSRQGNTAKILGWIDGHLRAAGRYRCATASMSGENTTS